MARSKQEKAKIIFSYGEAFAEAADKLQSQAREISKEGPTRFAQAAKFAPMASLDAFAVELYLKCLHVLDFAKAPRGHDLKKLFETLGIGTQKSIRMIYNERLKREAIRDHLAKDHPRFEPGLDNVLELSKATFEKMRYLYELEDTKGQMFYWPMLRLAVRDTITAIHPDWNK